MDVSQFAEVVTVVPNDIDNNNGRSMVSSLKQMAKPMQIVALFIVSVHISDDDFSVLQPQKLSDVHN